VIWLLTADATSGLGPPEISFRQWIGCPLLSVVFPKANKGVKVSEWQARMQMHSFGMQVVHWFPSKRRWDVVLLNRGVNRDHSQTAGLRSIHKVERAPSKHSGLPQ